MPAASVTVKPAPVYCALASVLTRPETALELAEALTSFTRKPLDVPAVARLEVEPLRPAALVDAKALPPKPPAAPS